MLAFGKVRTLRCEVGLKVAAPITASCNGLLVTKGTLRKFFALQLQMLNGWHIYSQVNYVFLRTLSVLILVSG
jgi:hypothetical protein